MSEPPASEPRTATLLTRLLSLVGEEIAVEDPTPSIVQHGTADREAIQREVAAVAADLGSVFSSVVDELQQTRGSVETLSTDLVRRMDRLEHRMAETEGEAAGDPPELIETRATLAALREELEQQQQSTEDLHGEAAGVRQELVAAQQERERLANRLSAIHRDGESQDALLDEAEAAREAMARELTQAREAREALAADLDQARAERESLAAQLAEGGRERERLDGDLASARDERETLAAQLREARESRDLLGGELDEVRARAETLEGELERARQERQDLVGELESASRGHGALDGQLESARRERETLAADLEAAHQRREAIASELATSRSELAKLSEGIEGLQAQREELTADLSGTRTQRDELLEKAGTLKADRARLEAEIAAGKEQYEQLQRTLATVDADRSTLGANLADVQSRLQQRDRDLEETRTALETARSEAIDEAARRAEEAERRAEEARLRAEETRGHAHEVSELRDELRRVNTLLEGSLAENVELRATRAGDDGGIAAAEVARRIDGLERDLDRARTLAEERSALLTSAQDQRVEAAAEVERLEARNQILQQAGDAAQGELGVRIEGLQAELERTRTAQRAAVEEAETARAELGGLKSKLGAADQERNHLLANQQRAVAHIRQLESLLAARDAELEQAREATPSADEVIELTEPVARPDAAADPVTQAAADSQSNHPMKPPWSPSQESGRMAMRSGTVLSARKEPPKQSGLSRLFGRNKKR